MHFRIVSSNITFFSTQSKTHLCVLTNIYNVTDPDYVIKQLVQAANLNGFVCCHFSQTS